MNDQPPSMPPPRSRDAATIVALLGLLLAALALLGLIQMVLPQPIVLGLFAVIVVFAFYTSLHYLVWGRKLSRKFAEDEQSDDGQAENETPDADNNFGISD